MDIPKQKLVYCFALLVVLQVLQYTVQARQTHNCQLLVSGHISCPTKIQQLISHHDNFALCSSPGTLRALREVP